jgi:hypothetical protein
MDIWSKFACDKRKDWRNIKDTWCYWTDLENTTRTERRRFRNKEIDHAKQKGWISYGRLRDILDNVDILKWSNVHACHDVGGVKPVFHFKRTVPKRIILNFKI